MTKAEYRKYKRLYYQAHKEEYQNYYQLFGTRVGIKLTKKFIPRRRKYRIRGIVIKATRLTKKPTRPLDYTNGSVLNLEKNYRFAILSLNHGSRHNPQKPPAE